MTVRREINVGQSSKFVKWCVSHCFDKGVAFLREINTSIHGFMVVVLGLNVITRNPPKEAKQLQVSSMLINLPEVPLKIYGYRIGWTNLTFYVLWNLTKTQSRLHYDFTQKQACKYRSVPYTFYIHVSNGTLRMPQNKAARFLPIFVRVVGQM